MGSSVTSQANQFDHSLIFKCDFFSVRCLFISSIVSNISHFLGIFSFWIMGPSSNVVSCYESEKKNEQSTPITQIYEWYAIVISIRFRFFRLFFTPIYPALWYSLFSIWHTWIVMCVNVKTDIYRMNKKEKKPNRWKKKLFLFHWIDEKENQIKKIQCNSQSESSCHFTACERVSNRMNGFSIVYSAISKQIKSLALQFLFVSSLFFSILPFTL